VADAQFGLKAVAVSDPVHPMLLGAHTNGLNCVVNVAVNASTLAASDGHKIHLLNVSDPQTPRIYASVEAPTYVFDVALTDSRLYAACGGAGLLIYSVTPAGLALAGSCGVGGMACSVELSGDVAYVANGHNGWAVVSVLDPALPTLAASHTAQGPVLDLAVSGVLAALANGAAAAPLLDVRRPLMPMPLQSVGPLVRALRAAARGDLAFVAEDDAGLAISRESVLTLLMPTPADDGTAMIISWYSVPGKQYTVYYSKDLTAGFMVLQDSITATSSITSFTNAVTASQAFYIIGVR
jgi:hypothetical protein